MPDISMCKNNDCPLKLHCFRFVAKMIGVWQSYADFKYEQNQCPDFMAIPSRSQIKRIVAQAGGDIEDAYEIINK